MTIPGDYPGSLNVSQAGSTEMACSEERMKFERLYFRALSSVNRYGFSMGRLSLTWVNDEVWNNMLFEME